MVKLLFTLFIKRFAQINMLKLSDDILRSNLFNKLSQGIFYVMFLSFTSVDKLFVFIAFILFHIRRLLDRDKSSFDKHTYKTFSKQQFCKVV